MGTFVVMHPGLVELTNGFASSNDNDDAASEDEAEEDAVERQVERSQQGKTVEGQVVEQEETLERHVEHS
ncbi:hypothetical protein L1887_17347 [Cichorium endivia]|nr:hypothetical protein L1887_17347 [Cichorium endivia]